MIVDDCLECAKLVVERDRLWHQKRTLQFACLAAKIQLERLYNSFGSRWPIDFMDDTKARIDELDCVVSEVIE